MTTKCKWDFKRISSGLDHFVHEMQLNGGGLERYLSLEILQVGTETKKHMLNICWSL
jgi:hypothetical protein